MKNILTLIQREFIIVRVVKPILTQDVIWTSIQRFLNVMDVRWTSKRRKRKTIILFLTNTATATNTTTPSVVWDLTND